MKVLKYIFVIFALLGFSTSCATDSVNTNLEPRSRETGCPETPPKPIKVFPASYPLLEATNRTEGKVVVQLVITTEGTTRDIEVIESYPEGVFEEAAINAAKQYLFKPATKECKPVECVLKIPLVFDASVNSLYDYEKAIKIGEKRIANKEFKKAIELFSTVVTFYKKHSQAYYLRGLAYKATGNHKKALSDIKRAIKLDPESAAYYNLRGTVYSSMENYKKALEDFNKAIEINPAMTEAYINRGHAYNELKDSENACADFQKACGFGDCREYKAFEESGACLNEEYNGN